MIQEITAMRMEMLGLSFTAQHSDARIVDQLLYKWRHSRAVITNVLQTKFVELAETGWQLSATEIDEAVRMILGGSYEAFMNMKL